MSTPTPPELPPSHRQPNGRETYNAITDIVGGPNVRLKDNLFQGLAILVCLLLGAGIGACWTKSWPGSIIIGAFVGLLAGLFGSGIFLMIFRAVRHRQGRHD